MRCRVCHWNYLRMRGEESLSYQNTAARMELPPHARRRVDLVPQWNIGVGITSACAEKSGAASFACMAARNYLRMRGEEGVVLAQADTEGNYLRMRGEEWNCGSAFLALRELPPHARRRVVAYLSADGVDGITSACAEKRSLFLAAGVRPRNYLRMRGEECKLLGKSRSSVELPPHARRRESRPAQPNL